MDINGSKLVFFYRDSWCEPVFHLPRLRNKIGATHSVASGKIVLCKFHISRPKVITSQRMLSFAIMDDQVLRVGSISFDVLQTLGPDLTPEASFVLNRERVRHAAYVASRKVSQSLDPGCFVAGGQAADVAPKTNGVSSARDKPFPRFRVA